MRKKRSTEAKFAKCKKKKTRMIRTDARHKKTWTCVRRIEGSRSGLSGST